jgi:hypothetical protein
MISGFPLGETAAWSLAISTPRRFGVLIRAGNGGQGGTQCWHLWQRWHCGICNLQNLKEPPEFESHSLRHPPPLALHVERASITALRWNGSMYRLAPSQRLGDCIATSRRNLNPAHDFLKQSRQVLFPDVRVPARP